MRPGLDVLADPTRRTMLALLALERELCVCELEAALDAPQPAVSRHLAVLRDAGWVEPQREGRRVFYRLGTALPPWARQLVDAYVAGGVPAPQLQAARRRLHAFPGRPARFTKAAS
ncbi:MAG TPA: metalloregulator ArsR/SmtB family transcription factor [Gemmatimonadaceae bacterium]